MIKPNRRHHPRVVAAIVALLTTSAACSTASNQLGSDVVGQDGSGEPTVAGVTTSRPASTIAEPTTEAPTSTATSGPVREIDPAVLLQQFAPTGVDVPLLVFGDSILRVDPDGEALLVQRDRAIRVASDTTGGVLFQRGLEPGPESSILWQAEPSSQPRAIVIPAPGERVELHGVTTVAGIPEAVYSVTDVATSVRTLSRIDPASGALVELTTVDDAEFGSQNTQVDGLFVVTTWAREDTAGWTVYQSGTGRAIGGSTPEDEAACATDAGNTCSLLASLSLDIDSVFRITPAAGGNAPGDNDLLVTLSANGQVVTRVPLSEVDDSTWYPEHLSELPDGRILLSRSVDPSHSVPTRGLVIDPSDGSIDVIDQVGFVRLG